MPLQSHDLEAEADDRQLHRLLFFTDAVFAIVLTLLALELKAPEGGTPAEMVRNLARMTGDFVAFGGSFALVGIWWMAHMASLRRLARFDWTVAVLNLIFLLTVCLIPFSTSLISHGRFAGVPWAIYCWNQIFTSGLMVIMNLAVGRDGGRLLSSNNERGRLQAILGPGTPGVAFLASLLIMKFADPKWATLALLLIPLGNLAPYLFVRREAAAQ